MDATSEGRNYTFFQHKKCEYFPCHKGIKEEEFNCLFCFCPLYMLQEKCGGNFTYTNGVKDCSNCTLPHGPKGYEYVMKKMPLVMQMGSEKER